MAVVLPAIEERGLGAVEVFEERGVSALRELEFGEAGGVAVEEPRVGFEMLGATDDAAEIGGRGRSVALAVEGDEGVGEAAKIDAGALAEFHPVGVREDLGGRRSEEVTPVALVSFGENRTAVAMGTRITSSSVLRSHAT